MDTLHQQLTKHIEVLLASKNLVIQNVLPLWLSILRSTRHFARFLIQRIRKMSQFRNEINILGVIVMFSFLTACATNSKPSIPLVTQVELDKFMGPWYVIAHIPTSIEKNAFNAIETYSMNKDGTINTVFTFNEGDFSGEAKQYNPKGFVQSDPSNALWGMQFIWPIKAEYRIAYLSVDYGQTIIARNARDYVWLMARTPTLSEEEYSSLVKKIEGMGYDIAKLRKVPQQGGKP